MLLQKVTQIIEAARDGNVEILQDILEHNPSYANVKFRYGIWVSLPYSV